MSSAVISTSAALGRPFLFDEPDPDLDCHPERSGKVAKRNSRGVEASLLLSANPRLASITPASQLQIRPTPQMVSSGILAIDTLIGGLPCGCLTEICGPASSGRTTVLLAALAAATRRGQFCALIDASDALDPRSAAAAGVELDRLLWVRCCEHPPQKKDLPRRHRDIENPGKEETGCGNFDEKKSRPDDRRLEQVLRATDLLLESGGFGMIVLDLADLPPQAARRIPLTTWFRFRRAVENKSTILLAIEQHAIAGSCSSLLLQLAAAEGRKKNCLTAQSVIEPNFVQLAHMQLLTGLEITAELIRSRLDRKPARSVAFVTKTAWAG